MALQQSLCGAFVGSTSSIHRENQGPGMTRNEQVSGKGFEAGHQSLSSQVQCERRCLETTGQPRIILGMAPAVLAGFPLFKCQWRALRARVALPCHQP